MKYCILWRHVMKILLILCTFNGKIWKFTPKFVKKHTTMILLSKMPPYQINSTVPNYLCFCGKTRTAIRTFKCLVQIIFDGSRDTIHRLVNTVLKKPKMYFKSLQKLKLIHRQRGKKKPFFFKFYEHAYWACVHIVNFRWHHHLFMLTMMAWFVIPE